MRGEPRESLLTLSVACIMRITRLCQARYTAKMERFKWKNSNKDEKFVFGLSDYEFQRSPLSLSLSFLALIFDSYSL